MARTIRHAIERNTQDPDPAPIPQILLTYGQAAEAANVSDTHIRRAVARRELAVVSLGSRKCRRIRVIDLHKWIDARVTRAARRHDTQAEG